MKQVLMIVGFILLAFYCFDKDYKARIAKNKAKATEILGEVSNEVKDIDLLSSLTFYADDSFDDVEQKINDKALMILGDVSLDYVYVEHGNMGTFTHHKNGWEITYSITKNKFGETVSFMVDEIVRLKYNFN